MRLKCHQKNKIKFNQYKKSHEMPYIIYTGLESLIKKIDGCASNPEKSLTTKIAESILCGYSMSTIWGFDHIKKQTYFVSWKRLHEKVL